MKHPPQFIVALVERLFDKLHMEEVEGDFREQFHEDTLKRGYKYALLKYIFNLLRILPTYLRRSENSKIELMRNLNPKLYFKHALRSINKFRFYHGISILSLVLGLFMFMLIYVFVLHQYQKDSHINHIDRIVRISSVGLGNENTNLSGAHAPLLYEEIPEVENYARVMQNMVKMKNPKDNTFNPQQLIMADSGYFQVFDLDLLLGRKPLPEQLEIVISEREAQRLWGGVNEAISQQLIMQQDGEEVAFNIVGIFSHPSKNTSTPYDYIAPLIIGDPSFTDINADFSIHMTSFFLLNDAGSTEVVLGKIKNSLAKHTDKESILNEAFMARTYADIQTNPKLSSGFILSFDKTKVDIFAVGGILLLVLALGNYFNNSTALIIRRVKELGVRKLVGASTNTLLKHQAAESLLIALVSSFMAYILVYLALPKTEELAGVTLTYTTYLYLFSAGVLISLVLVLGTSLYPAILFGNLRASSLLTKTDIVLKQKNGLRYSLVLVQFSLSLFLVSSSLVFIKQTSFLLKSHNIEETKGILTLYAASINHSKQLKAQLKQIPEIKRVSFSSILPSHQSIGQIKTKTAKPSQIAYNTQFVDKSFFKTLAISTIEGEQFNENSLPRDVLLNESFARLIGSDSSIIGKHYPFMGKKPVRVLGIIKDFHTTSLKSVIEPTMYVNPGFIPAAFSSEYDHVILELSETSPEVISKVGEVWDEVLPEAPYEPYFLNDRIATLYKEETNLALFFKLLTGLAIALACLGVFSLVNFIVDSKLKEIGIRKVLGADFKAISRLIGVKFFYLIVIGSLIGIPFSYNFLESWLSNFAYRTNVGWDIYLVTFIVFFLLISLTLFGKFVQAFSLNPVKVLKDE